MMFAPSKLTAADSKDYMDTQRGTGMKRVIGWAAVALGVLGTATTRYGYVKGYEDGSRSMREAFEAQEKYAKRITRASR